MCGIEGAVMIAARAALASLKILYIITATGYIYR
jgi:hypothetical protein